MPLDQIRNRPIFRILKRIFLGLAVCSILIVMFLPSGPYLPADRIKALKSSDPQRRAIAASALGSYFPVNIENIRVLAEVIRDDPENEVRRAAAGGLSIALRSVTNTIVGNSPPSKGEERLVSLRFLVNTLVNSVQDPDLEVRRTATAGLADSAICIKSSVTEYSAIIQSIIPELLSALDDEDARVRYSACHAFDGMGTQGGDAIPKLSKLVSDRDQAVRQAAFNALRSVRGEPALPKVKTGEGKADQDTQFLKKDWSIPQGNHRNQ